LNVDANTPTGPELTAEMAIQIGGFDPRYARVLVIATIGDTGITLVDPNGDGNHEEIEHVYRDDTGQWVAGSSSGGGSSDTFGPHGWGEHTPLAGPGVRYAYGRAEHSGPQNVTLQLPSGLPSPTNETWWVGRQLQVTATEDGWWTWVEAVPDD
jgi:hypothetical protein